MVKKLNEYNQSIFNKILAKDEIVKENFSISDSYIKFSLVLRFCLWSFLSFIFSSVFDVMWFFIIPISILLFYYLFYIKRANIYVFTNKRVLIHSGWLSTNLISVDYNKITDVTVTEKFFQRVFTKSGDIKIDTAGTTRSTIILDNVNKPYEIKSKLDDLKDHYILKI